jgi:hypothetical protein
MSGQSDKKVLLSEALREYIQKHAKQKMVEAFSTFNFDPDRDCKALRQW